MPARSISRSPDRRHHASSSRQDRSRDRDRGRDRSCSFSPRRDRVQDRGRRDEERDRWNRNSKSRSRSRLREQEKLITAPPSLSRRRPGSRSCSRSPDQREKQKRRRSLSSGSSDTDDGRKRRKRNKKNRRKESRERRKEKKREKKEKRDKKRIGSSSSHWGKHGVLSEVDIFNKRTEFHAWLVEERKINPETLSKNQEKKEFAHFVEDFNTATLPHEKFYDMAQYERRMDALRKGEYLPPAEDTYDPAADMLALSGAHKKKVYERESYMSREQLEELRKVQSERVQVGKMKLLGMDVKQNMGIRMDGTVFDDF